MREIETEKPLEGLQHLLAEESSDGRTLANNLEDNPICTVSHDPGIPCLVVRWKGYATSIQIRYIHECLIRLIAEHRVGKVLGDDTELVSIAEMDQHWIVRDWMPRAISAGLRTAASIKPHAHFGQTSISRILSITPADLAVRSFDSAEEARNWLCSVYQPGIYRVIYRRFKGGEPINSFAFHCEDPSRRYFKQVARVALRAFWKSKDGTLEPFILHKNLPELIVIESDTSEEVCRWSLADELRYLNDTPTSRQG
jgi:hypothetical protein